MKRFTPWMKTPAWRISTRWRRFICGFWRPISSREWGGLYVKATIRSLSRAAGEGRGGGSRNKITIGDNRKRPDPPRRTGR
ncbi:hypothetical protein LMG27198_16350 [Methylocystis echinoides]|uniref:Uncharacterized protein n=1 Tax=Methylocystis echinoides TaxID=29468 RepID=A0A9W6GTH5_9HYPH|nr:hypothetical protein LMG27198_16350 [Methylocystis echinoides]